MREDARRQERAVRIAIAEAYLGDDASAASPQNLDIDMDDGTYPTGIEVADACVLRDARLAARERWQAGAHIAEREEPAAVRKARPIRPCWGKRGAGGYAGRGDFDDLEGIEAGDGAAIGWE